MANASLKKMISSPLRQIQSKEGWVKHPLDEQLRAKHPIKSYAQSLSE
jgi:hypothetical protein